MMRFNSEAERQTYNAWNESILQQADHRLSCSEHCSLIDCPDHCSIMGDRCETGRANATRERETWLAYHQARQAETAQLAGVVDRMEGSGL